MSEGRDERDLALEARAWPFEEARKLIERTGGRTPDKGYVLFETGYGPSGLPHIGTFGEVVRTTMVRQAFQRMSDIPTRLFCFSDDMDGLRKVPDNIPNKELVAGHLHEPLTQVPDPFGQYESFGHHNNAMLRRFLDSFGFEYEFQSSTDWYRSGRFDQALLAVLGHYDEIMEVMLPSLREERQQSYSPFLPISPRTGRVLQVPILEHDATAGTIVFEDEDGARTELPVTGGHCKLQWKPDWGMRWHALGVDYEMSGKDLIDSVKLASRICSILGSRPPEGFNYELFLDEEGKKISKSKGNGLSVDEWLRYGPPESLALFMYQKPRAAKRLYFDVIPRAVDDYLKHLAALPAEEPARRLENPAWHIHSALPESQPGEKTDISFSLLLNLVGTANAEDKAVLWGFISRYAPEATPESDPLLDKLVGYAIAYYRDFVLPTKAYRRPAGAEAAALQELLQELEALPVHADPETIQNAVYEVGKRHAEAFPGLRDWFKACYEILLGQEQGPRLGSFFALYGLPESRALIGRALAGELAGGLAGSAGNAHLQG
ncbi:lysyl-tRNA synthetase, class I [Tistlia consotensis]|uniref:Lysine--tRNA ligase n=1 Tax=Tistlia consotensis USBA 355 TaxID=560819 RepID=A0A1Y6C663_9PROT|nr:lysine--tRNA ligase [Tistlia consotensis]SMF38398.1 lysyl-tRNA synthetase, class I [Tistlia consotensis USBA 355]SNR37183.1 lysyl-tRNA synthetase, class I [Tistlia consotensis]